MLLVDVDKAGAVLMATPSVFILGVCLGGRGN